MRHRGDGGLLPLPRRSEGLPRPAPEAAHPREASIPAAARVVVAPGSAKLSFGPTTMGPATASVAMATPRPNADPARAGGNRDPASVAPAAVPRVGIPITANEDSGSEFKEKAMTNPATSDTAAEPNAARNTLELDRVLSGEGVQIDPAVEVTAIGIQRLAVSSLFGVATRSVAWNRLRRTSSIAAERGLDPERSQPSNGLKRPEPPGPMAGSRAPLRLDPGSEGVVAQCVVAG